MTDEEVIPVSKRLLRPYVIPDDCPYLSEDQRELSKLTIEGRSAWMAEWLALAASVREGEGTRLVPRSSRSDGRHANGDTGACPR